MKFFHGSYIEINEIDLTKSKPFKDFGRAFYLTKYEEQAKIWADRLGKERKTIGVITEFEFNEYAYEDNDLKVLVFNDYSEEWLDFIVFNRSKMNQSHEYDIVEGPVADDAITLEIENFLESRISKVDFLNGLKYHKPTHQIAFCTLESLQMLEKSSKPHFVSDINDAITQSLVTDFNFSDEKAIDLYFQSNIYEELNSVKSSLHEKTWEEIYRLLLVELSLSKK